MYLISSSPFSVLEWHATDAKATVSGTALHTTAHVVSHIACALRLPHPTGVSGNTPSKPFLGVVFANFRKSLIELVVGMRGR